MEIESRTPVSTPLAAFGALLSRDLRVLRKTWRIFTTRTLMQPLLLVFVFTYVFPRIGQGIGGQRGAAQFSTLLVAGVIGLSMVFQGIQSVALPLVQEFGYTREIEDRVLAPLPVWAIAVEKIAAGAIQALIAGLAVFPLAAFIPATPVHLRIDWPVLVVVGLLAALLSGALGLAVGTQFPPQNVPLIFAVIVLPLTFLGATYYPWTSLQPLPWLKAAVLVNPLVYVSEGLRAALTRGVPHMQVGWVVLALTGFVFALGALGVRGFHRRVIS